MRKKVDILILKLNGLTWFYIQNILSKSVSRRVGARAVINHCMYRLLTIINIGHFVKLLGDVSNTPFLGYSRLKSAKPVGAL